MIKIYKTKISPNHTAARSSAIDVITPHCYVGHATVDQMLNYFSYELVKVSCNYVIDDDGRIGECVPEKSRSWCSSSSINDNRAITIECASDNKYPYRITDKCLKSLIDLMADICKRHWKKTLIWKPNNQIMHDVLDREEMIISVHRWFANKECPGEYIYSRLGEISKQVTDTLQKEVLTTEENWAINNGIVLGDGTGKYNFDEKITKKQFVDMLYRYENKIRNPPIK